MADSPAARHDRGGRYAHLFGTEMFYDGRGSDRPEEVRRVVQGGKCQDLACQECVTSVVICQ